MRQGPQRFRGKGGCGDVLVCESNTVTGLTGAQVMFLRDCSSLFWQLCGEQTLSPYFSEHEGEENAPGWPELRQPPLHFDVNQMVEYWTPGQCHPGIELQRSWQRKNVLFLCEECKKSVSQSWLAWIKDGQAGGGLIKHRECFNKWSQWEARCHEPPLCSPEHTCPVTLPLS